MLFALAYIILRSGGNISLFQKGIILFGQKFHGWRKSRERWVNAP